MDVVLVRHGEAEASAPDHERLLSARGREQIEALARTGELRGFAAARIVHSGLVRARQTAEILARTLAPADGVHEMEGLAPYDDPSSAARVIGQARAPLILVGHLPHLGRLAALLVIGDPEHDLVAFGTGSALALVRDGPAWKLRWMVRPSV
jgi:phosphohistidine phosphatase